MRTSWREPLSLLVTGVYQVEFTEGKVTELDAGIIAESIYTQCDAEGNEYFS